MSTWAAEPISTSWTSLVDARSVWVPMLREDAQAQIRAALAPMPADLRRRLREVLMGAEAERAAAIDEATRDRGGHLRPAQEIDRVLA